MPDHWMRNVFQRLLGLRTMPLALRWAVVAALVLAAFLLRSRVFTALPPLPMLFFLPAIMLSALVFGRGGGFLATALSAALAAYFFLPPVHGFTARDTNAALSLALFAGTGLFIAVVAGALHDAHLAAEAMRRQTEAARARAEAGERERELLLVEFGHRVKNDMQRLASTLRLKAACATPEAAAALRGAADQVNVVAAVHDRLAHRRGEVLVGMDEFLEDLVAGLRAGVAEARPVGLFVEAERHMLPHDRAGAVGLIANELVTNALKHAFPGDRAGAVTVGFRREGRDFVLAVADDGIGLPDRADQAPESARGGMGRKLVRALAAQLGGKLETRRREPTGTAHRLTLPVVQPGTVRPLGA